MDILRSAFLTRDQTLNIFEAFEAKLNNLYLDDLTQSKVKGLSDLTLTSTKYKGYLFELLTKQYLLHIRGCQEAYLLAEISPELRHQFKLKQQDVGIDLIARKGAKWVAIQCKWRQLGKKRYKHVTWRELATFYAMTQQTGPWHHRVVVTSCDGVRHQGKREKTDITIGRKTWLNLDLNQWYKLLEIEGNKLNDEVKAPGDIELLRQLRLLKFET